MNKALRTILLWLQWRCTHPGEYVAADILSGDAEGIAVRWCRICGAWTRARRRDDLWNRPEPTLWD